MTRNHSTINLRVLTGDCRGVCVTLPRERAVEGQPVKVAGWSYHRVRRSRATGKLYLAPIHALEQEAV